MRILVHNRVYEEIRHGHCQCRSFVKCVSHSLCLCLCGVRRAQDAAALRRGLQYSAEGVCSSAGAGASCEEGPLVAVYQPKTHKAAWSSLDTRPHPAHRYGSLRDP